MSYFAKPNFIIYDEWFDEDLEKTKLEIKNKKIKTVSNVHNFFYMQSNYKVGASENNLQLVIQGNEKELININYLDKTSEKFNSISTKEFRLFEKIYKSKLKFLFTKKIIFSLSIFGFVFILGFLVFFISHTKKSESNLPNKSFLLEKEY